MMIKYRERSFRREEQGAQKPPLLHYMALGITIGAVYATALYRMMML